RRRQARSTYLRYPHFGQPQVPRHRPKIAVIMEERNIVLDAPCANQQIDCFADSNASSTQKPEILSRQDGDRFAAHWYDFKKPQQSLDFSRFTLALEALQNPAKHQITDNNRLGTKKHAQAANLGHIASVEKVNPYAAVDNNHFWRRPSRLRARLPRQRYFPNALL